jgi:Mn-dependent DtxR family transcriptional regulator
MPSAPMPSQTAEDYLERIHQLIEQKGYARVVDIASSLQVKQASVTNMVQKLGDLGYINYEKYRGLILTDKGREVGCKIRKRHETLARFFFVVWPRPRYTAVGYRRDRASFKSGHGGLFRGFGRIF